MHGEKRINTEGTFRTAVEATATQNSFAHSQLPQSTLPRLQVRTQSSRLASCSSTSVSGLESNGVRNIRLHIRKRMTKSSYRVPLEELCAAHNIQFVKTENDTILIGRETQEHTGVMTLQRRRCRKWMYMYKLQFESTSYAGNETAELLASRHYRLISCWPWTNSLVRGVCHDFILSFLKDYNVVYKYKRRYQ